MAFTRLTERNVSFAPVTPLEMDADQRQENCFFFFTRSKSARQELMMNMGVATGAHSSRRNSTVAHHTIDVYWKAPTFICINQFVAVLGGKSILELPGAIACCGYLLGFVIFIILAANTLFCQHRMLEVPQRLGANIEFFEEIALRCFGPGCRRFVGLLTTLTLFGLLLALFHTEIVTMGKHFKFVSKFIGVEHLELQKTGNFELWVLVPSLCLLIMPFAFRTSAKSLHCNSRTAVLAMRALAALVCLSSISAMVMHGRRSMKHYVAVNGNFAEVLFGVSRISYAFSGIFLLPSILGDMHDPGSARKVCNRAMFEIMIIFGGVGFLGYFGFATDPMSLQRLKSVNFIKVISPKGDFFSRAMRVLITIENFNMWALYFCPWRRSIEAFLNLESEPAVALKLPWALRRLALQRAILRVTLMLLVPVIYLVLRLNWEEGHQAGPTKSKGKLIKYYALGLNIPICLLSYLLPALCITFIWSRLQVDQEESRESPAESAFFFSFSGMQRRSTVRGGVSTFRRSLRDVVTRISNAQHLTRTAVGRHTNQLPSFYSVAPEWVSNPEKTASLLVSSKTWQGEVLMSVFCCSSILLFIVVLSSNINRWLTQ